MRVHCVKRFTLSFLDIARIIGTNPDVDADVDATHGMTISA